ncbi:MAG: DUF6689 family protein [Candidatus Eisenbacteria bacterium]
MKLRSCLGLVWVPVFGLALMFASAVPARADFQFVRSIPAPYESDNLTGLDTAGQLLVATDQPYGDCSNDCSLLYLIDPADGTVTREAIFPEPPPGCDEEAAYLTSCAYVGDNIYWVADACGDVMKVLWTSEDLTVVESFMAPSCCDENPYPTGMVSRGVHLYLVDPSSHWIVAYDDSFDTVAYTLALPERIVEPSSVTLYRGNFLVASEVADTLFEVDSEGAVVEAHWLEDLGETCVHGVTFIGDELYVAGSTSQILIFEPISFTTEVPPGDSVVVEAVPDLVTVTFDSVSTGGTLEASVSGSDSCPAPPGVTLLPDFYSLSTDALFEYAAQVVVATTEPLPPGIETKYLRVFVRPSGACQAYRDITVGPAEETRTLLANYRSKSEDDEFSVFVLGEDRRAPRQVIELKFEILEGTIDAGEDSIPPDVLARVRSLLDGARDAYYHGSSDPAATLADSIAMIVRATPAIPHTYDPEISGRNLAGRLISDAHTLGFSLRFSAEEATPTAALMAPELVNFSRDGWGRACIEAPAGFSAGEVDPEHIFLMHTVRAVPDSVSAGDCDSDGTDEIIAVFSRSQIKAALEDPTPQPKTVTCFMSGFEVYADVTIGVLGLAVGMMEEGPYLAGSTQRVIWEDTECGFLATSASLWYSPDAGATWELVAADVAQPYYDWAVPELETERGVLKVVCTSDEGLTGAVLSGQFTIKSSAGLVDADQTGEPGVTIRPNPSASAFAIDLALQGNHGVMVSIYSVRGELVKTMFAGQAPHGTLALFWRGDNEDGAHVSSGAYFIVVRDGLTTLTRKVILER